MQAGIVLAVVLILVLAVARYALPYMEGASANHGGSMDGAQIERLNSTNQELTPTPSDSLAAARTRPSAHVGDNLSGDSAKSANAHPTDVEKHKALVAYHRAVRCREYAYTKRKVSNMPKPSEVSSPQHAKEIVEQLDKMSEILQTSREQCEGVSLEEINKSLFEFSMQAGIHGDLGAQACFVHGVFFSGGAYRKNEHWTKQYLTYAPRFMENGIDDGYWPTVSAAVQILMDSFGQLPPALNDLPQPDPYKVYRAVRLTYYRSDGEGVDMLQYVMETLASRHHISPQQIAEADRWAQQVYQQRFADTPTFNPWNSKDCQ